MANTVKTSPYYAAWLASAGEDLRRIREGIMEKDFSIVGETAEKNCLKMHATMLTAWPSLLYWTKETVEILHAVASWRNEGLRAFFTIDAGPQVKILCLEEDREEAIRRLLSFRDEKDLLVAHPGEGARLTDEHLF